MQYLSAWVIWLYVIGFGSLGWRSRSLPVQSGCPFWLHLVYASTLALETPYCNSSFLTPSAWARPIDASVFQHAFSAALGETEPPLYWILFLDAQNDSARGAFPSAILGLALSIEVARDTCFPAFARTEVKPDVGEVLKAPFDGTDLLRHLSSALERVRGRSLKREDPARWLCLKELYTARHHIAHGKPPVFRTPQGLRRSTGDDYARWLDATFHILTWLATV